MIVIHDNEYTIGRMTAMEQFKVARKLGPALPVLEGIIADRNSGKDTTVLAILMMSKLSDVDAQIVTEACLAAVTRKQGDIQAKVMVSGNMMFQDIDVTAIIQLVTAVIHENLGDFFRSALANLHDPGAARV